MEERVTQLRKALDTIARLLDVNRPPSDYLAHREARLALLADDQAARRGAGASNGGLMADRKGTSSAESQQKSHPLPKPNSPTPPNRYTCPDGCGSWTGVVAANPLCPHCDRFLDLQPRDTEGTSSAESQRKPTTLPNPYSQPFAKACPSCGCAWTWAALTGPELRCSSCGWVPEGTTSAESQEKPALPQPSDSPCFRYTCPHCANSWESSYAPSDTCAECHCRVVGGDPIDRDAGRLEVPSPEVFTKLVGILQRELTAIADGDMCPCGNVWNAEETAQYLLDQIDRAMGITADPSPRHSRDCISHQAWDIPEACNCSKRRDPMGPTSAESQSESTREEE